MLRSRVFPTCIRGHIIGNLHSTIIWRIHNRNLHSAIFGAQFLLFLYGCKTFPAKQLVHAEAAIVDKNLFSAIMSTTSGVVFL